MWGGLERNGLTTIKNFVFYYSLFLPITKSTFFSPSLLQPIKETIKRCFISQSGLKVSLMWEFCHDKVFVGECWDPNLFILLWGNRQKYNRKKTGVFLPDFFWLCFGSKIWCLLTKHIKYFISTDKITPTLTFLHPYILYFSLLCFCKVPL